MLKMNRGNGEDNVTYHRNGFMMLRNFKNVTLSFHSLMTLYANMCPPSYIGFSPEIDSKLGFFENSHTT